jgi:hypothetical protein
MVRADGNNLIIDNAWLWHADHDDCTKLPEDEKSPKSDECMSSTGLVVNGDNVIGYGLAVEHTKQDLVEWQGENGKVFFFQSELPYRSNLDFGTDGYVGYKVGYGVQNHVGHGIGVYQVFQTYSMKTSMRLPPTANLFNAFTWCITGNRSGLGNLTCTTPGTQQCVQGDCDGNSCQVINMTSFTAAHKEMTLSHVLI